MTRFEELARLEALSREAAANLKAFLNAWASDCELKAGDIVECTGYSHTGKRMVVDRVFIGRQYTKDRVFILATGRVLTKNGSPGVLRGEHQREIEADA